MHARPLLVLVFLALNGACSAPQPETPNTSITYVSPTLGLVFELPADWIQSSELGGEIFSGPRGSETYYTTIVVQSRHPALRLDDALESEFQALASTHHFAMDRRGPEVIDGQAALAYTVQFDYQEMPRRKTGVLFRQNGAIVDLSLNAPTDLFYAGVPAFEAALASLTLATALPNPTK